MDGRYELHGMIGSGAMADVYRATDRVLGREVAIKILARLHARDPASVERFRREAQSAAALSHPNIVSIYDWGPYSETYAIVMEYVPGPNLRALLDERGPLAEAEALELASQIASALESAHKRGVVHRDVKPHNVLLGPGGRAKVTDFGLARAAGQSPLTESAVVLGTPLYLSPEQLQALPADNRSDLYSLGVVLYELLTGQTPFSGDSVLAVALQHINAAPHPPGRLREDVSPATDALVLRALAKHPADRYQTAGEMREVIEQARRNVERLSFVAHTRAATPPPSSLTQTQSVSSRHSQQSFDENEVVVTREYTAAPPRRRWTRPTSSGWSLVWLVPLLVVPLLLGAVALRSLNRDQQPNTAPRPTASAETDDSAIISISAPTISIPTPRSSVATPSSRISTPTASVSDAPAVAITAPPQPAPTQTAPPTLLPEAAAMPALTPTSEPQPSPPPTEEPALVAPQPVEAGDPAAAVARFYALAEQHEFDRAAQLWSARMQANYPPGENIAGRFGSSQSLTLRSADVVAVDEAAGHATVAIDLVEQVGGASRRFVGTWQLVRGPNGWLLDQPSLRAA